MISTVSLETPERRPSGTDRNDATVDRPGLRGPTGPGGRDSPSGHVHDREPGQAALRRSDSTRWTSRELLFHTLFGHLVTRAVRYLVTLLAHTPRPHIQPAPMVRRSDRLIASLQRHLDDDP